MKALTSNPRLLSFLIFVSLFLVLLDSINFLSLPKLLVQTITAPIQFGFYTSGKAVGQKLEFIALARQAALENHALRKQMGELLVENSTLRKKLSETENLVESYNKLNPLTFDLLPARVLGISR
ncbi:MAG: hypothetical protein V1808_04025, partial [Candidatus Daviesbacteria bacterium]